MGRPIHLQPHLRVDDLEQRYRSAKEPNERTWWRSGQILWLLAQGHSATELSRVIGYRAYWIGQIAKRYNQEGPEAMVNRRHTRSYRPPPVLAPALQEELRALLAEAASRRASWTGHDVATCSHLDERAAWAAGLLPARLELSGAPQALAAGAAPTACLGRPGGARDLQKKLRPLLRQVATAFPTARVELWAVGATDEHRIGLKPLVRRVWAPIGHRPVALVRQRFAWRSLVGFVHPASGRTVFHLAPLPTSVSIALFEVELAAFARQVGASPTKQIVLVLDRAGWHTSRRLRVPEHIHLLFLPPYSPELQPAEHLWPLTNTCLVNRQFATIEELEDAQFARCAALQARPDLIRSTTCFHWWPRQIHKRLERV
jgi:transposase